MDLESKEGKEMRERAKQLQETCQGAIAKEEWHGFIGSEAKPDNVRFATVPNVIPSELVRAADMDGFIEAIMTNMEAPFERLLGQLEQPPVLIVADTFLPWAIRVGNRRNVPAASFWPMPASVFSVFQHFHLLAENGHFPVDLLVSSAQMDEIAAGLRESGVWFIWVARGETGRLKEAFLRVAFLAFPLLMDQGMVSNLIVENWKVGLRLKKAEVKLVTSEGIAGLVKKIMDLEDEEKKEMRRIAREVKKICYGAIAVGGSSETINAFIRSISQGHEH
ncbi:hypothetical protein GBA52_021468 [Prunus armeniaca]|nr:hypothetical protein GBA52_021468 [Prunus armeniaca]